LSVPVGADGIRSRLRAAVVGPELQPSPSHHSAYRFLVPVEKINAHEDLKKLRVTEPCITMVDGKDRRIITYPCRNSTLINFVCCLRE
jgi:salicylate hydroxylase